MTFAEFYEELQKREGSRPRRCLIDSWPMALMDEIKADFDTAISVGRIKNLACPLRRGSSNQSIGNQVEMFITPLLDRGLARLGRFRLEQCKGTGYPDRVLVKGALRMPCEMKATSKWNPADSNRRVLTSSSKKLRREFRSQSRIHHLLLTVIYDSDSLPARIVTIRLDFLEPKTPVDIRLEASVSHKLLTNGEQMNKVF